MTDNDSGTEVIVPDVRWDPTTGRVAISTGLDDPNRIWFVYVQGRGGVYTSGEHPQHPIADWLPYGEPGDE